jgi:excisionase family DNA binding protein
MQTNKNSDAAGNDKLAVSTFRAAEIAGVGRTTIYEAIANGALKSVKIGKRRLIRLAALDAWLQAQES